MSDEERARWRQWAREEQDPEYRREFYLRSLTWRQRVRRSLWMYVELWWIGGALLALLVLVGVLAW